MKEKFAIHLAVQRFIQEKIFLELMLIALKPYFQYLFLQKNKTFELTTPKRFIRLGRFTNKI